MLLEISIRNIALIEQLTIEFAQGFNVLTGETGAGKSIVVDSLSLALGARAGRELLRTGAERASVQALFDVSDCPRAQELAAELGAPCEMCIRDRSSRTANASPKRARCARETPSKYTCAAATSRRR